MSAQYRSIHILFLKGAERQYLHVNDALLDAVNNEKNLKVVFNYKIALYMYKKNFFYYRSAQKISGNAREDDLRVYQKTKLYMMLHSDE